MPPRPETARLPDAPATWVYHAGTAYTVEALIDGFDGCHAGISVHFGLDSAVFSWVCDGGRTVDLAGKV